MALDPLDDLGQDKSFWSLRSATRPLVLEHVWRYRAAAVGLAVLATSSAAYSKLTVDELAKYVRDAGASAFAFTTAILGILIAGFAIFTAVATSDAARALAFLPRKLKRAPIETSQLRYITLNFARPFVEYLQFAFLYLLLWFVALPAGLLWTLASWLATALAGPYDWIVIRWATAAALGALAYYVAHLLVELATFVFNTHAAFMTIVLGNLSPALREQVDRAQKAFEEKVAHRTQAGIDEMAAKLIADEDARHAAEVAATAAAAAHAAPTSPPEFDENEATPEPDRAKFQS